MDRFSRKLVLLLLLVIWQSSLGTNAALKDFSNVTTKSLSQNGYYKLPDGLLIQWGTGGNGVNQIVYFPTSFYNTLKSATKLFSVLLASKRPLITELADKLRLKYPLLPTISPCPTMRLEAIRSIIPISCRRYPKSV